ncbi:hypothetical protein K437DRAFT_225559 [Tilletiaria anomala UBC 951]|uniref:Histone-lysine N-methyltransferase SET5 n=1 Tax=Tilletiaria anomala (strain ATCC 24038 / CBS 436.72 / UBC 951) TaxID=1037660 RepID=A0A066VP86_TILAU|nr:uncharacterized protein K437DRAFT_225559 [Tilletiaria anomala UBC 951]KDN43562.1 hypothetical protein K437DRAFT_225559 [Tilletiaria anomala UBC 951]
MVTWELSEHRLKKLLKVADLQAGESTSPDATNRNVDKDAQNVHASGEKENGSQCAILNSGSKSKKKKKKLSAKQGADPFVPSSSIDPTLPLPSNVESHYFDAVKGKGLLAAKDFAEGEVIFTEDAYIPGPPGQYISSMLLGELCDYCFLPVSTATGSLSVACSQKKDGCHARWCNRLCANRAMASHHPLMCDGGNYLIRHFNHLVASAKWGSALVAARSLCRILLTHSARPVASLESAVTTATSAASVNVTGASVGTRNAETETKPASAEEVLRHINAFATVNDIIRRSRNPAWALEMQQFTSSVSMAYQLLLGAIQPESDARKKLLEQADSGNPDIKPSQVKKARDFPIRGTFPKAILDQIFTFDYWQELLGRANINMENHGSLFLVHSQLNHACRPNVSIRHMATRGGVRPATKITAVANTTIKKGDELVISYLNLSEDAGVRRRRLVLWRDYMFGPCDCLRCSREVADMSAEERAALETELKSGDWKHDHKKDELKERVKQMELMQQQQQEQQQKKNGDPPQIEDANGDEKSDQAKDRDLSGLADEVKAALGY